MGINFTDIATTDTVTAAELNDRLDELDTAIGKAGGSIVGELRMWVTDSAPSGWLLCYGQAISRTTYAGLFAVIGTTFGTGDGSTTFNLPDMRGRAPVGQDDMGGSSANRITAAAADSIGGNGGAETHTLTTDQLAAHQHASAAGSIGFFIQVASGGPVGTAVGTNMSANSYSAAAGTGQAHNNLQPYIALNFIIYTGV